MKNKKLIPTKVIAGSLASIILAQSCAEAPLYYLDEDVVRINQELKSANINSNVVPIELVTNAEENNYLNFLNKLAKDIIEQPVVAKSFATNPAAFMERYGFPDMEINLDEGMLKLILALGDNDFNEAIKSNDVVKFIELCKSKNLISNIESSDIAKIEDMIKKNPDLVNLTNLDNPEIAASFVAFAIAIAVGAIVAVWAIVASHVIAANVATAATVLAAAAGAVTVTFTVTEGEQATRVIETKDPQIVQLWALKGGNPNQLFAMGSEYEETLVDNIVNTVQKEFPERIKGVNIESIKQLIKLNLRNR